MATEQLPVTEDIDMVQGDDFPFDYVIKDSDGNAIDFSTHTNEKLQVRRKAGTALLDEYTTSGGTLTTTAGGRVTATFTSAQTTAWPETCKYAFESEDSSGNVRTYQDGQITVNRQVAE